MAGVLLRGKFRARDLTKLYRLVNPLLMSVLRLNEAFKRKTDPPRRRRRARGKACVAFERNTASQFIGLPV
jgi:hypothetical protein